MPPPLPVSAPPLAFSYPLPPIKKLCTNVVPDHIKNELIREMIDNAKSRYKIIVNEGIIKEAFERAVEN